VPKVKPIELYIEKITLKKALQNGLIDKLLQQIEKAGIEIAPVVIVIDPREERGLIKIGHNTPDEALQGGLRITFDPRISEHVIEVFKKVLEEVFTGER